MLPEPLVRELIETRRDLHRHPELGFQERRTQAIVRARLAACGYDVNDLALTGVVGILRGGRGDGPTVMLRADMDALPIQEANQFEHASVHPGVMHACGHDGHVAMGLAAARLLAESRDELAGTIKYVFQPGEEGHGGAARMVAEGVLDGVDMAIGLHIQNRLDTGKVGVTVGPCMAATDRFVVEVEGISGHAAKPHEGRDAVVAAAHIVMSLQTLVSRRLDPRAPAVVTVGRIEGGTAFNILAGKVRLEGTCRALDVGVAAQLPGLFEDLVAGCARAMGVSARVDYERICPVTVNDAAVASLVRSAACRVVGEDNLLDDLRNTAGEDMACYLEKVPGCFFFLGARKEADPAPHHHPRFDFDETALPIGVRVLVESARQALGTGHPTL